jgi:hypothetical protein
MNDIAVSRSLSADLIALESLYGAKNYKPLDVVLTRGSGVHVWDVDGNRYLDCLSAYSAVNQGHCHPKILAAMTEQAGRLTLTSRAFRNDQLAPFYEELCALTGSHKALPMNSGAEAVESAIKVARKWGYEVKGVPAGQAEIVVAADNFHGRTVAIVGFSTDPQSRGGFGPFAPGFKVVPYGDAAALEAAIGPNTVAFLVEPIQGEAGVIIPPAGYLKRARELCTQHNVILILDEIQTGLGRTGKLLAEDPDRQGAERRLLSGLRRALQFRGHGRPAPGRARLDLRRQSAGLRRGPGGAAGAGRGRHDRQRRADGRSAEGVPGLDPRRQRARGARPRPDDRRGAAPWGRRRAARLRGAAGARPARQGDPRAHHPHRPTADPDRRPGRLDRRTVRGRAAVSRARSPNMFIEI